MTVETQQIPSEPALHHNGEEMKPPAEMTERKEQQANK